MASGCVTAAVCENDEFSWRRKRKSAWPLRRQKYVGNDEVVFGVARRRREAAVASIVASEAVNRRRGKCRNRRQPRMPVRRGRDPYRRNEYVKARDNAGGGDAETWSRATVKCHPGLSCPSACMKSEETCNQKAHVEGEGNMVRVPDAP